MGLTRGPAGHPRRGERRWQGVAALCRCVRRHRRHRHDPSGTGRHRVRAVAGACRKWSCATTAANRTPPSRRTWGSTRAMRSRSPRWRSACCASNWRPGQMMHGIVTDGGSAPNVIPAHTEMRYTMRAADSVSLRQLEDRVGDCFLAAALATGCDYEVAETSPTYAELAPDPWLAEAFRDEMQPAGPHAGARRAGGVAAAGQHRHGKRHPSHARHPSDRRSRRGRCLGASAGVRGRR